jgi:FemAB-related protein (PEP-CTERM system-associated)
VNDVRVGPFDGTAGEWDTFVRSTEGSSFCHAYTWRPLIERVFGHRTSYLCARNEQGQLMGALPLVLVQSALFGKYLVSMPFLSYGGPVGTPDAIRALAGAATVLAGTERVRLLELRARSALPLDLPASTRKVTVVLDLAGRTAEEQFRRFDTKLRSQVRRPIKEGMTVRFGPDQVQPFYGVFARHMRDLGTPVMPRRWFTAIVDTFGDEAWCGCVYKDDEPVAGGLGFRWGAEFEITWASSLRSYSRQAPNMLLYWAFIERALGQGVRYFNFGRCTPGGGTHRFKRQWGAEDEQLWWYQGGAGTTDRTPSPDAGIFALATRVWQRLPLPLTNALGPSIVRGIP